MELSQTHLLHRTSPPDKLDGPPMFKCGIGWDLVEGLGKDIGVRVGDLLWEEV
jgi:origin recognition complex subunit 5